jgi:hypothetical protein
MTSRSSQEFKMGKIKTPIQKRRPKDVIRKGLPESLPTSVQKSYFMLTDPERNVLNIGLQKYRPGQSEPILIGGAKHAETGVAIDERLPIAHRRNQRRRGAYHLHPVA